MKTRYCSLICLAVVSCSLKSDPLIHPDFAQQSKVLDEVVAAFASLRDQGKLPGMTRGDHGRLETLPIPIQSDKPDVGYPQTVTIKVQRQADPDATLFYSFRRETAHSKWILVKAWQEQALGQDKVDLIND